MAGREHIGGLLERVVTDWLDPLEELVVRLGVPPEEADAHARLGLAVVRGLLLDLLATGDVDAVQAAAHLHLAGYRRYREVRS